MSKSTKNISLAFLNPVNADLLSVGQAKDVLMNYLSWSGLAIMPSDCSYALCGLPQHPAAMKAIDALLDHGKDPIPVSVSSAAMAARYTNITALHQRLMSPLWPGQLTMVAATRTSDARRMANNLHGGSTMGVRVSLSAIERQLATEADQPITSAAIRGPGGTLITSYDEAVDIVLDRLNSVDCGATPIIGIRRRRRLDVREHSTVVELQSGLLKVLREGAVGERMIRPLMNTVTRAEYGDAT